MLWLTCFNIKTLQVRSNANNNELNNVGLSNLNANNSVDNANNNLSFR